MEDNVKEISEVKTSQPQAMFDIEKEHKKHWLLCLTFCNFNYSLCINGHSARY